MLNAKVDTTLAGAVPNKISALTLQAFCVVLVPLLYTARNGSLEHSGNLLKSPRSKEILSTTRVSQNHIS